MHHIKYRTPRNPGMKMKRENLSESAVNHDKERTSIQEPIVPSASEEAVNSASSEPATEASAEPRGEKRGRPYWS